MTAESPAQNTSNRKQTLMNTIQPRMKLKLRLLTLLLLFPPSFATADDDSQALTTVVCEGTYGGIATDGKSIYWSHTTQLVKTDRVGKVSHRVDVKSHHGDLTYYKGLLYVAVEFGEFNRPSGQSDPWVFVYDADDLSFIRKHHLQELVHGCGGIAQGDGRFIVVGGLPGTISRTTPSSTTTISNSKKGTFCPAAKHGWESKRLRTSTITGGLDVTEAPTMQDSSRQVRICNWSPRQNRTTATASLGWTSKQFFGAKSLTAVVEAGRKRFRKSRSYVR